MPPSTLNHQPSTWALPSLRPAGFWRAFDSVSTGKALMVVWHSLFGIDFPHLRSFLQPTPEHSLTYPCTRTPWCECDHEVSDDPEWDQVAVCTCGDCEPFPLTRQDTILHALNRRAFGEAVRQALGFRPPVLHSLGEGVAAPLAIGHYPPLHAPVYFYAPTSTAALSAQLNSMLADNPGPFLLLTPTATFTTPAIHAALTRAACIPVALSTVLTPPQLQSASVNSVTSCKEILARWSSHVANATCSPGVLENLHRELAAVRQDFVELRTAKQRLEKMQADGVFAFTQKVDATSFKILCAVLAHGDVAKAGRTLGIGDPMMRKLLRQWRTRGPAYQAMLDLVRWRKKIGRTETMPLNHAILHEKADTTDYPALLSDVLDGLLSMTETNWQGLAEELAELLRPAISAGTQLSPTAKTPIRTSLA